MSSANHLADIVAAFEGAPTFQTGPRVLPARAVFVGSGDSLSAALLAEAHGHRAMSSGDITWMGRLPPQTDTVVGISHSGTSGATVRALRLAREAGVRTIAITANPDSPLAEAADQRELVPSLLVDEVVPVAGYLMLALGVAAVCGEDVVRAVPALGATLRRIDQLVPSLMAAFPDVAPGGISVISLPELRGAGDFWMLKLIEATGLPVRSVALEESGHVDYFIGAQPHLVLQLIGKSGIARHERLGAALRSTGQTVREVPLPVEPGLSLGGEPLIRTLAGAVVGTLLAEAAAERWGRPPFRGGAVNMDAEHIKLEDDLLAGS